MSARGRSLLRLGAFAAVGVALLAGLGVWQLHRLAWKEALIAEVSARASAPPVEAPPPSQWQGLSRADYEYRHVAVAGVFRYDRQALVFRAQDPSPSRYSGPGYLVLTPLTLASGGSVIVNRGFVPLDAKDRALAAPPDASRPIVVTGLMRAAEPRNFFTPSDNPQSGEWFTRDPIAIAKGLGLEGAAPFIIDADASAPSGEGPSGGATALTFPNNHLAYAMTWFGMALALAGVFGAYALSRPRA